MPPPQKSVMATLLITFLTLTNSEIKMTVIKAQLQFYILSFNILTVLLTKTNRLECLFLPSGMAWGGNHGNSNLTLYLDQYWTEHWEKICTVIISLQVYKKSLQT